jgi:outer membrane cobalamin receptor
MDEVTHQESEVELESYSIWKLTTTHTFKNDYFLRFGVDNIFDFVDETGGYNNGTPGRTFFIGLGINI